MAFAKSQLGLLLSLDHRRLDDRQSLETRKAVAQKKECYWSYNRWMDSYCQHEWFQHVDLMPSSASWKKDSSGSLYFIEENGWVQRARARMFHLFTSSPGYFFVVVGFVLGLVVLLSVGFLICTQVFCMAFAKGQLGLHLSLDHRRLDDRQSLGARTAAALKKNCLYLPPSYLCCVVSDTSSITS